MTTSMRAQLSCPLRAASCVADGRALRARVQSIASRRANIVTGVRAVAAPIDMPKTQEEGRRYDVRVK